MKGQKGQKGEVGRHGISGVQKGIRRVIIVWTQYLKISYITLIVQTMIYLMSHK